MAASPAAGSEPGLFGVRILWDRAHGQAGLAAVGDLAAGLAGRGAELAELAEPWTPGRLSGCDVFWCSTPAGDLTAEEVAAAVAWVRGGGCLLLTAGDRLDQLNRVLDPLGAGIRFWYASRSEEVTADLGEHESTAGIGALYLPGANARLEVAGGSAVALARDGRDRAVAAAGEPGAGRILAIGEELFGDGTLARQDNRRFGQQVLTWLGGYGWLQADPRAGVVPPGGATTVKLSLAPQGRCGSLPPARLEISCNDPAAPEIPVAVALAVAGVPEAVVSASRLEFGAHYLGTAAMDSFTVDNRGCAELQVSPSLDDDTFTCRPASAFTVPAHGRATVVVTWRPDWPRPTEATLALATDDPGLPLAAVTLRGLGIAPPVLALGADSLAVALAPDGRASRTLTLTNNGWDDLRWRCGTVPAPGSGGSASTGSPRILLLLTDSNSLMAAALSRLDLPFTMVNNWNSLNSLLRQAGDWDLVAVENTHAGAWETGLDALAEYVDAGGRLLFSDTLPAFYAQHRLAGLMGVDVSSRWRSAFVVQSAPPGARLFRAPQVVGPVRSGGDPSSGQGLAVTLRPGAAVMATFAGAAAEPAIVRGPGGGTLFHAFPLRYCQADDDGDGVRDMVELVENELFALGIGAPWVTVTPAAGLVPRGASVDLTVAWDATGLCGRAFDARLFVESNDPLREVTALPLSLVVGDAPRAAASPAHLAIGDCQLGGSRTAAVAIANRGCAPLVVTGAVPAPGPFTVASALPLTVAAGDSGQVTIAFAPTAPGPFAATLAIATDDPARPELSVHLSGNGLPPPVMAVATDTLAVDLAPGGSLTAALAIANPGLADLHWTAAVEPRFPARMLAQSPVFGAGDALLPAGAGAGTTDKAAPGPETGDKDPAGAVPGRPQATGNPYSSPPTGPGAALPSTVPAPDLADVVARLDLRGAALTALIPGRFDFDGGTAGNFITDGGLDMFDGGNALYTDLGGPLPYADGRIVDHAACGDRGRYVTRKLPGLFVLAADLGGIASFGTSGNLGADGAGRVDGVVLEMTLTDGRRFLGLARRVWGAGDPSVNHLVIVEAAAGIAHSFLPDTDSDFHEVTGLAGSRRLYYLLFASAGGGYVDNAALARMMEMFLGLLGEGTRWLDVAPASGTLAPGASAELAVTFAAGNVPPGDHLAALALCGNDPLAPRIEVPVRLRVAAGAALAAATPAPAVGSQPRSDPNPFNPRTEVRFALAAPGEVEVLIYDARGLLVRRLSPGLLPAGPVGIAWDGKTAGGQDAGSGVYLFRVLQDGRPVGEAGKMMLVR